MVLQSHVFKVSEESSLQALFVYLRITHNSLQRTLWFHALFLLLAAAQVSRLRQIAQISDDIVIDAAGEDAVVIAEKGAGDEDHHGLSLLLAGRLAVDRDEALLHGLPPFLELGLDQLRDLLVIVRQHIGLGRGVGALLPGLAVGHIGHKGVHVRQVALIIPPVVLQEPGLAFFGHKVLGVAHIADHKVVPALKIIEELGVGHPGLRRDIAQRDLGQRLFFNTALEGHQNLHTHGLIFVPSVIALACLSLSDRAPQGADSCRYRLEPGHKSPGRL